MKVTLDRSDADKVLGAEQLSALHGATLVNVDLRKEVIEFAVAMEAKLRKNDHKTGWKDQPIEAHIKLLRIEMMELDVALDHLGDEEAMRECVDIANFAMIIRDKLKQRIADKQCKATAISTGRMHPGAL